MSAPLVAACRKCGKPGEIYELGMLGPSGLCVDCLNAYFRALYAPAPIPDTAPRCGYCGAEFRTWCEAWHHEDHAHGYEQRVTYYSRPSTSEPGDCRV
jgi:hypothetical protein